MPVLKLKGITSFCVAGVVVQPDANGVADVPESVLLDPEFARLRSELKEGQSIEAVQEAPKAPAPVGGKEKAKAPKESA